MLRCKENWTSQLAIVDHLRVLYLLALLLVLWQIGKHVLHVVETCCTITALSVSLVNTRKTLVLTPSYPHYLA